MGIYNSINEAFEKKYGLMDVKPLKKLNESRDSKKPLPKKIKKKRPVVESLNEKREERDLWDTIYGELTSDGEQYVDPKTKKPYMNKGAGYDFNDQVTTDRNGNIVVRAKEERDFKPAIDIANKYAKQGVKYNIAKGDYGKGYTYGMTIEIPYEDKMDEDYKDALGKDVEEYQDWVDYDMKRYGKVSNETKKKLDKAGLQLIKSQHGQYEVAAKSVNEARLPKDDRAGNLGDVMSKYQQWVDYDMKRYHKVSDITKKELEKAGLELMKDDHGDYEVIAKDKKNLGESFKSAIKNWLKDDKAASIVYGWYDAEDAFDDFEDEDEFISYAKRDIKDMLDAGGDEEEARIVRKALHLTESRKLRERYYYINNNLSEKKAFWQSMRDAGASEKQLMAAQKGDLVTLDGAKYHILDKALPGTGFREGYSRRKIAKK